MQVKISHSIYKLYTLVFCFFLIVFVSCDNYLEKQDGYNKIEGLILNIAADAIIEKPEWEDIDTISKENAIRAIEDYIDVYANTQVSTLLFNVNYQRACYDSKIMESFWNLDNPDSAITGWPLNHWKIYKMGIDVYDVSLNHSRKRGISPWISFRMNDHHYFTDSTKINQLWLDHPELRLSPSGMFDYSNKDVRDYYIAFIEEALEKYDVDGIELDWMRTHTIFKENEAAEGINLINEFMKEVRQITEQVASKRGHSIQVAVRVPSTPAVGRRFGLDGAAWVKDGLVDVLVPTNWYVPTNFDIPVELWKSEIGPEPDYTLAPGADFAYKIAENKYLKSMKSSAESMCGFTVASYSRGADAIYLFNNFDPSYKQKIIKEDGEIEVVDDKLSILREAGNLESSLNAPRKHVYTFTNPDTILSRKDAPALPQGEEKIFKIYTGTQSAQGEFVIRVGLDSKEGFESAKLKVKLNNKNCSQIEDLPRDPAYEYDNTKIWDIVMNVSETGARVMQFKADINSVKEGYNLISVTNINEEIQAVTWLEVYIDQ